MACSNLQVKEFDQSIDVVYEAFEKALPLAGAGVPIKMKESHQLLSEVSTSLWSWGEKISVSMKETNTGGTRVQVKSESSFGMTLIDWGKNKKNVDKILMQAKMILHK